MVSCFGAETKYRALTHAACEMMWLKILMIEPGFHLDNPMTMHCDNQAAIYIAKSIVFDERSRHKKVNYHFVRIAVEEVDWHSFYFVRIIRRCVYVGDRCWR